jgi:hypothetical protein
VDIGAAEGYFAVGVLLGNSFMRTIAFEADANTRAALRLAGELNGIPESDLIINGKAEDNFIEILQDEYSIDLQNSVFLIDIEGGEVNLLTERNLRLLAPATVVIELHPAQVPESELKDLWTRCSLFHEAKMIESGPREPGEFLELKYWLDDERWLIVSEGRYRQGEWLVLSSIERN